MPHEARNKHSFSGSKSTVISHSKALNKEKCFSPSYEKDASSCIINEPKKTFQKSKRKKELLRIGTQIRKTSH